MLEGNEDIRLFVFLSSPLSWSISAVFCGKKVILASEERLSLLALMHIHRLTDNDKVVSAKKSQFGVTKFEKHRIHVFQNVHNTVSNNRIPPHSGP